MTLRKRGGLVALAAAGFIAAFTMAAPAPAQARDHSSFSLGYNDGRSGVRFDVSDRHRYDRSHRYRGRHYAPHRYYAPRPWRRSYYAPPRVWYPPPGYFYYGYGY
jgi:hypothetical protein